MSEDQQTPEENSIEPVKNTDAPQDPIVSKPPFETTPPPFNQFGGMPQQNLPNATVSLVLGILSIPGCCCYGILGLILGIIAWVLAKSDIKKFYLHPGAYSESSLKNAKAGKVCGIIGTILGLIYLVIIIVFIAMFGFATIQDPNFMKEWVESMR